MTGTISRRHREHGIRDHRMSAKRLGGRRQRGIAGIGILPAFEEALVLDFRFVVLPFLFVNLTEAVMIQRMDEIADPAFRIDRRQPLVLRDRLVEVSLSPVSPGQDIFDEGMA